MKYIELVKGQFTAEHVARSKQEEPYVAYSEEAGGVMYTFIPEPVTGPTNNEIWYKTTDNHPYPLEGLSTMASYFGMEYVGPNLLSNTYREDLGYYVAVFDSPVTTLGFTDSLIKDDLTGVQVYPAIIEANLQGTDITSYVSEILLPDSVTDIKYMAFLQSPLTSIKLSPNIIHIGHLAFWNCTSLTSVTIPSSVTSIGSLAFGGCSSLTSVTIGNSVTSIEEWAFSGCSSLTSVTFEGTVEEWNNITKVSSWNSNVPATYVQCTDGQVEL